MVEIVRVSNGIFEVSQNGVKTDWEIVNGSRGVSGYGRNIYCIYNNKTGKFVQCGTLNDAKKSVKYVLAKKKY